MQKTNDNAIKLDSTIPSYNMLWKAIIRPNRTLYSPSDLGNPYIKYRGKFYTRKDFELLNRDGHILKCSFVEPNKESRPSKVMPVVIYLHGNSSSRMEGLGMLSVVLRHNINLFCFDFAGSGLSEGEFISLGYKEKDDVKVVIDYLEKQSSVGKIGLWGRSMGAATTMLYAHKDPRVSAICMDSPFAEFRRLAKEMCLNVIKIPDFLLEGAINLVKSTVKKKNGLDIDKLRPIDCAAKTTIPAIFIHAETDELISYEHTFELSEAYMGEKTVKYCLGFHNSPRPKKILDEVGKFFAKNMVEGYKIEIEPNIFDEIDDENEKKDENENNYNEAHKGNDINATRTGFESL